MSAKRNLLIGMGVGAVLGILFAPHKGSKTRKKIAKRGTDLKEGWENLKETVANKIEKSGDSLNDFIDESREQNSYISSTLVDNEWKVS
ncbi:MAG: YtxH domain-containing protein [Ferruginibacter sp.]|nr:YtxH domain-containing protein [Ferruginibacter sp.]